MISYILLFLFCAIIVFLLYPVFVYLRYLFFRKNILRSDTFLPPVSIIISCYNEDKYIEAKIRSYLDEKEWITGSEIIVVSSGCTDNSNAILDSFALPGKLRVIKPEKRMSKISAVNLAADLAIHDFLVFSDCRQKMKSQSVKKMIHNFNDPNVGTVVSTLEDPDIKKQQSFSRSVLNFINYYDGQTGSCMNVYGALYAQRKELFRKFPDNIIFDDLFVVVSTLRQKKWLIQERAAVIYDIHFDSYYSKERIERLVRGLLLFLFRQAGSINQLGWDIRIRFMLYKYMKLILPFFLLFLTAYGLYFLFYTPNLRLNAFLAGLLLIIFCFKRIRAFIILTTRINLYFILATLRFVFFNKRSVSWEKLKTDTITFSGTK